jgi:hypothetical protein
MRLIIAGVVVALVACDSDRITEPASAGVLQFETAGQAHTMSGMPSSDPQTLLSAPFAVAQADSLGGFAIIGYEETGADVGNLIVLQAARELGTFECPEAADACDLRGEEWHGRYIEGVRGGSTVEADRYFHLVSGTITVTQIEEGRLRATFSGVFLAGDEEPDGTLAIEDGSVDLPYVNSAALGALLRCVAGGSEQC